MKFFNFYISGGFFNILILTDSIARFKSYLKNSKFTFLVDLMFTDYYTLSKVLLQSVNPVVILGQLRPIAQLPLPP